MQANIKGFFNPTKKGDKFAGLGLGMGIDGQVADDVIPDIQDFLKAAGRNYYIKKSPAGVFDPTGAVAEDGSMVPAWREADNQFHLVRSTDGRVVSPHTVSNQYAPLSLMDVAEEIQPWFDAGFVAPDGVYSGRNESLEMLALRVNDDDVQMPNDEKFRHYIVFQNPHGSGGTAKGKIISWRIDCKNTFAAAASTRSEFVISHRVAAGDHEAQQAIMQTRAKDTVNAWEKVQNHFKKMAERITVLSDIPMDSVAALGLTRDLLDVAGDPSTRTQNRIDAIMGGFDNATLGTRGETAWDWLNAVTSFTSNGQKGSKVSVLDRTIRNVDPNGTGFKLEQKAESILAKLS